MSSQSNYGTQCFFFSLLNNGILRQENCTDGQIIVNTAVFLHLSRPSCILAHIHFSYNRFFFVATIHKAKHEMKSNYTTEPTVVF